ncbi:MAG: hypothetical protein MI685_09860 [Chlorobiales bacterium]|nr:hypothetical protein [Chlorobiales bacterium]
MNESASRGFKMLLVPGEALLVTVIGNIELIGGRTGYVCNGVDSKVAVK